jgi:hypothetical protein
MTQHRSRSTHLLARDRSELSIVPSYIEHATVKSVKRPVFTLALPCGRREPRWQADVSEVAMAPCFYHIKRGGYPAHFHAATFIPLHNFHELPNP